MDFVRLATQGIIEARIGRLDDREDICSWIRVVKNKMMVVDRMLGQDCVGRHGLSQVGKMDRREQRAL